MSQSFSALFVPMSNCSICFPGPLRGSVSHCVVSICWCFLTYLITFLVIATWIGCIYGVLWRWICSLPSIWLSLSPSLLSEKWKWQNKYSEVFRSMFKWFCQFTASSLQEWRELASYKQFYSCMLVFFIDYEYCYLNRDISPDIDLIFLSSYFRNRREFWAPTNSFISCWLW